MADNRSVNNDYVRYTLKSETAAPMQIQEPIGWQEDDFELDRHETYHGIFTKFTNNLKFKGKAKDYIETAFAIQGINANVYVVKEVLRDLNGDVKWVERYVALADFNTRTLEDNILSIKFNSNNLATLIQSHETDDYEMERLDDIDGNLLPELTPNNLTLDGRHILEVGESVLNKADMPVASLGTDPRRSAENWMYTPLTTILTQGNERHVSVDVLDTETIGYDYLDFISASNFFYNNDPNVAGDSDVSVDYTVKFNYEISYQFGYVWLGFIVIDWQDPNNVEVSRTEVWRHDGSTSSRLNVTEVKGTINFPQLKDTEGIMFVVGGGLFSLAKMYELRLVVNSRTYQEATNEVDFMFAHDIGTRLMNIICGRKNAFYSKFLGRTELGYAQDDELAGLVAITWGFWIRKFSKDSEKYKSLTISLQKFLDSLNAVFNTGVGIETNGFEERLRVEKLEYFYQPEVVIRLPQQIRKVKRTTESGLYWSATEFGYKKGGTYEEAQGLDEPNTRTSHSTPIRKSKNKYQKLSEVRADDYGLELIRRKNQERFGSEDTNGDNDLWWLDIKRSDGIYKQKMPLDRLNSLPTGIYSPTDFRSMIFTPLRMLFRHAWILKSGMEQYYDKNFKYINSASASTLVMDYIGDTKARHEHEDIPLKDTDRPILLAEEIQFEHPLSDDLLDLINGATLKMINGEEEYIPNVYFKFEWLNENEQLEQGYLLNLKPKKQGVFKMIKSNENLIKG